MGTPGPVKDLEQRHFLTRLRFEIVQDGVVSVEKSLLNSRTTKIPFGDIASEATEVTVSSRGAFWLAAVPAMLAVVTGIASVFDETIPDSTMVFWGAWAVLAGLCYWSSRKTYCVFAAGGAPLVLLKDRPDENRFAAFVAEVQRHREEWLATAFPARGTEDSLAEELMRLTWLKERGSISEEEFERLKARLIEDVEGPRGKLGF